MVQNDRCPHLNASGLCDIIISHGEAYLSEICRNHPRFFNNVSNGSIEAGLGIVCEEACRIILEDERPFSLLNIGECNELCENTDIFNPLPKRDEIISVIEKSSAFFDEKINILQDMFDIFEVYTPDEWIDFFLSLEVLDAEWHNLLKSVKGKLTFNQKTDGSLYDKYYKRLLTYFVYRHVSVSESMDNLRSRLAFAIISVKMIRGLFEEQTDSSLEKLIDFARRYSAEIEYSDENTDEMIFELESLL